MGEPAGCKGIRFRRHLQACRAWRVRGTRSSLRRRVQIRADVQRYSGHAGTARHAVTGDARCGTRLFHEPPALPRARRNDRWRWCELVARWPDAAATVHAAWSSARPPWIGARGEEPRRSRQLTRSRSRQPSAINSSRSASSRPAHGEAVALRASRLLATGARPAQRGVRAGRSEARCARAASVATLVYRYRTHTIDVSSFGRSPDALIDPSSRARAPCDGFNVRAHATGLRDGSGSQGPTSSPTPLPSSVQRHARPTFSP
jgi:hypothetical protein